MHDPGSRPAPERDGPSPEGAEIRRERDQLRIALQMVLDFEVFDGAGRAVTVEDALRGYVATAARVALRRARPRP